MSRRFWRWLGWGALGLGLALLFRRGRSERGGQRERRHPGRRGKRTAAPEPAALPGELPAAAAEAWIAGPAGTLRTAELHPGGRRALLFVHGLGGRLEHWAAQLAALGPGLRGVALDLPGHGGSDSPSGGDADASVASLAASVIACADAYGLRRAVLVGHGLGAAVAAEVAARWPGRVSGLLLADPHGDPTGLPQAERDSLLESLEGDAAGELAWSYRQALAGAAPGVAERVLDDLAATDPEVLRAAMAGSLAYSPLPALESYRGPVASVVSQTNDLPTSLHRLVPGLATSRLTGTGHWLMMDASDAFNRLLDAFLDRVRAGEG